MNDAKARHPAFSSFEKPTLRAVNQDVNETVMLDSEGRPVSREDLEIQQAAEELQSEGAKIFDLRERIVRAQTGEQ